MKTVLKTLATVLWLTGLILAQQPQVTEPNPQSLQGINAKWSNGVAPGYYARCSPTSCSSTLTLSVGAGTCFDTSGTRHTYAGGTLTMTGSSTNYVYLTASSCALTQNTTGYPVTGACPLVTVTATTTITAVTDDRTWFGGACAAGSSSGGGANKIPFDQCTAGQTTNAGNSFWTVFAFTNWDAGHWEFVLNTAADVFCSVRVPSNQTGTMQIILDLSSADTVNGHTATFNTADACTVSLNPQVGALTAAATQNYSSTTTAYSNTELTFNVQSTCAIDQILVVQIHQATGGTNTSNIIMQPPKLKVM